ncbi:MAG TPA: replication-associated recombination protein A [Phycisphaerales bacterium]|nr:replication-associated recombination protein A [Phycisphaerales bacterium]
MSDLWSGQRTAALGKVEPLASRLRPKTIEDFVGQDHILGATDDSGRRKPDSRPMLRRMIEGRTLTSILLYGPPGTGKTSLAEVIANSTSSAFVRENAANVSVKRIREIIDEAVQRLTSKNQRTILFLDEIHRFTRAQQDVLLEDVERGRIILIGATTENPMFAVNSALVSRSTVFRLEPLTERDVERLVRRAITDPDIGFGKLPLKVTDEAIAHWSKIADGDARRALNALEVAVQAAMAAVPLNRASSTSPSAPSPSGRGQGEGSLSSTKSTSSPSSSSPPLLIDLPTAEQSIQQKAVVYSRDGDQHYDTISAFIKSVRGSDPDAAIYWLALMIEAGEDPRFIARRLSILASEDIGNADPHAITLAASCWEIVERIGMPEGRITLAQCTTYLALAPKSNASYTAIDAALDDVREGRTVPVPIYLRDSHKPKSEGSPKDGSGYEYAHTKGAKTSLGGVTTQDYLGVDKRYFHPSDRGHEKLMRERLDEVLRARRSE